MRLKHIDIMGFKSFADKVVFSLSDGITAIVGPNGSGKSNVADAVRWVLGEQSARVLRGTKMEDVIFNGTITRRPTSLCEVTLVFDNEDEMLPMPTSEVAVTRRLFRNGDSAYLINDQVVRMRDIQAMFYDTGVGREGYSIIGQGRIEEILSSKGEERREALEEAAGVIKYKIRREEARNKLGGVSSDIVRIEDILTELEQSLEPLREQKEQAQKAIECRQRLKTLEINLFLRQYERNRSRVESLGKEKQKIEQEENACRKLIHSDQQELDNLENKLKILEDLLNRARDKRMDINSVLQRSQSQQALAQQRLAFLMEEHNRLDQQVHSLQAQLEDLCKRAEADVLVSASQLHELERAQEDSAQQLEALNRETGALEEHLNEQRNRLLESVDSDAQRKANLARVEALRAQAQERKREVGQSLLQAREDLKSVEEQIEAMDLDISACQREEKDAKKAFDDAEQKLRDAKERLQRTGQALLSARGESQRLENILKAQTELMRDFEGYANSVKRLMQDIRKKRTDETGVLGTVAELLRVPKEYETAVEQVLGGSVQNVVVDSQNTAKRLIAYLRNKQYGRVTFLPLQSLRVHQFSATERSQLGGQGVRGIADELIGCEEAARRSIAYLLGRTVIVEDMDAGIVLTKKCAFSFRCVTLKGDIIQSGGAMTGGSVREFSLVSRDRLVQQAQQVLQQAQAAQDTADAKNKQAQADVDMLQTNAERRRTLLYEKQGDLRQKMERLELVSAEKQRIQLSVGQLMQQYERIKAQHADVDREMDQIDGKGMLDDRLLRETIDSHSERLASVRERRDALALDVNNMRAVIAVKRSELKTQETEQARLQQEMERVRFGIGNTEKEIEQNGLSQQETRTELARIQSECEAKQAADDENRRALTAVQAQLEDLYRRRTELSERVKTNREIMTEQRENKFQIETQLERLELDFEYMQSRLWENYELTYANALPLMQSINVQNASRDVKELREQIHSMGDVNLGAVEEYKRVAERFEYLTTQKGDLTRAREDLEELIHDLTSQMQRQFVEQFEIINGHFDRIFKQLFKGGKAELMLVDPRRAMECPIDIIAQPPGKNLQLITLLSGGERALTAIALLFALLEVHATPFCILDEIESSLDDENLRLFAEFLRTYAEDTQFVIITHRRPTMETASHMYGIAMEEAGVSKTVSVKFA